MKTLFEIPGFLGKVNMTKPIIEGGSFTWGELLHWDDFNKTDIRVPREAMHSYNLVNLAKTVQPVRDRVGKAFIVTSGYRPDPYNKRAGGAKNSMHKFGKAVDFVIPGFTATNYQILANDIYYDWGFKGGVGCYSGWLHLDIGTRRKWGF